jgi:hypothetical protein
MTGREKPTPPHEESFDLEAYLERQWAEFTDGPTMAEILEDVDKYRANGIPRHSIVADIRKVGDALDDD